MKRFLFILSSSFFIGSLLLGCGRHPHWWGVHPNPSSFTVELTVTNLVTSLNSETVVQPLLTSGLDFGKRNIYAGRSLPLRINVKNLSTAPIFFRDISLLGEASKDFVIDDSTARETILPGETLSFRVWFSPTQIGLVRDYVHLQLSNSNKGDTTYTIPIQGIGTDQTMYVSSKEGNDKNNGLTRERPKKTIQNALDTVASTPSLGIDTILVEPGDYPEQVYIRSPIALIGRNHSSKSSRLRAKALPNPNPNPYGNKDLLVISGAETPSTYTSPVEVANFVIEGPTKGGCGSILSGIRVRDGAFAYIHDNSLINIREEPMTGCQNGFGILVGHYQEQDPAQQKSARAFISHNRLVEYQKAGIVVGGVGSRSVIMNNEIISTVTPYLARNGIILHQSSGSIENNQISGNLCEYRDPNKPESENCGPEIFGNLQGAGIVVRGPTKNVSILRNQMFQNDAGILVVASHGVDSSEIETNIENNLLAANRRAHLYTELKAGVKQNILTGSSFGTGMILVPGIPGISYPFVNASENHIVNNDIGVLIADDPNIPQGTNTLAVFSKNNLLGLTASIKNQTIYQVNAQNNYWGITNDIDEWIGPHIDTQNYATVAYPIPPLP